MKGLFEDRNYQELLLTMVVKDHAFLRQYGHMLKADDFRPVTGKDLESWTLATLALEHYERYHSPIGKLLTAAVKDHAHASNLSKDNRVKLQDYAASTLVRRVKSAAAVTDLLVEYKKQIAKTHALNRLIELNGAGELTDEEFRKITSEALDIDFHKREPQDYFKRYEDRIKRRLIRDDWRYPLIMVDPLDVQIRIVARSHLGVIVAPAKRGKSLALGHIATAYSFQDLNVLYFTLEDPLDDLEDRLDSMVSAIPIKYLAHLPNKARWRLGRALKKYRGKIWTFDGTDGGVSVSTVEKVFLEQRDLGNLADVIIVDYDDEIKPPRKQSERRFEFADIYRELRQFAAKHNVIVWTAAQSNKISTDKKIITEKDIAEDYSKIRKCSFALSIGMGEWGDDSYNLWVMAHRNDRKGFSIPIMSDLSRMLFYDREATLHQMKQAAMGAVEEDEP